MMKGVSISHSMVRRVVLSMDRNRETITRAFDWVYDNGYRTTFSGPVAPFTKNRFRIRAEKVVKK